MCHCTLQVCPAVSSGNLYPSFLPCIITKMQCNGRALAMLSAQASLAAAGRMPLANMHSVRQWKEKDC